MKKLRCGVIGLGRVGKMHVENMYLLPQLDIICAADYFIEEMSDWLYSVGNDSNLLIVFYVQIMPDDFVMQLHRF